MKILCKLTILFLFINSNTQSQNLIRNSSFSEVKNKGLDGLPYQILQGEFSHLKDWYIPSYIKFKEGEIDFISYTSSRDKDIYLKNKKFTLSDQLFENNLGLIYLHLSSLYKKTIIQQKLQNTIKKGSYYLKFKYKKVMDRGQGIGFCFSKTDLDEIYKKDQFLSFKPQVVFRDTIQSDDKNLPWVQSCFKLELTGDEKYLTVGFLNRNNKIDKWSKYYIDDIELYPTKDSINCSCQLIELNLSSNFTFNFPINEQIINDSCSVFLGYDNNAQLILAPPTIDYLKKIISFMQRNSNVKIKFYEFEPWNSPNTQPTVYRFFKDYLVFYKINSDRITVEKGRCYDPSGLYCGPKAQYIKMGFEFWN